MKSTSVWNSPNTGATNSSGFSGLPGGLRGYDGSFNGVGVLGYWWSASAIDSPNAWGRYLYYNSSGVIRFNYVKTSGFSVRVVRD